AHAAGRVVLGEAIGGEHVRVARIAGGRVGVVRALFRLRGGVRLPRVERVVDRALERLVVRGQRAVLQSRGDPDPTDAIGMQDEGLVAGDGIVALRIGRRFVVGPLRLREIRYV